MLKSKVIPSATTHILHILKDDKSIIAYDSLRFQSRLSKGEYPCELTSNPNNSDVQAFRILEPRTGLYVNLSHLQQMGSEYYRVSEVKVEIALSE